MRESPFADLPEGPGADALVVDVGGPRAPALGCFGATAVFLALLAVGALTYAAGAAGPTSLHVIGRVLGSVFAAGALALVVTAVRAVRAPHGLAVDATGVWWRDGRTHATVPWADVAEARVVLPPAPRQPREDGTPSWVTRPGKRERTSATVGPTVQLCLPDVATVRRHRTLTAQVISAEPWQPGQPALRLRFPLPAAALDAATTALDRFGPPGPGPVPDPESEPETAPPED